MFHQSYSPHQQNFVHNRSSMNFSIPSYPFFYRSNVDPVFNQSRHNLNSTQDFERFSMPTNGYPFYDHSNQNFDNKRWNTNGHRTQPQYRQTPAFHFQDKSTSYYMTDPIITSDNRITIQLTKVHVGPNGDQQRVFVEQEFSNEYELNKFVRNLRHNFDKAFRNRSSAGNNSSDENHSTNRKKPNVVVVEEPDEEPKVYQQKSYEEKTGSKIRIDTPIRTTGSPLPNMQSSLTDIRENNNDMNASNSSPVSQISSASKTHSHRQHRNKKKYRRQHTDDKNQHRSSRIFQMPSFSRHFQATPIPTRFQQRMFTTENNFHIPRNMPFNWKYQQNGNPTTRSRSFMPSMNENDPFFRPIHPARYIHRQRDFCAPPSPMFSRTHFRQANQPMTVHDHIIYPNQEQKQPRVHRTKSECHHFLQQEQINRTKVNNFQNFTALHQPSIIQRHVTSFRSPPILLTSVNSTKPFLYPNQRQQFGRLSTHMRLINNFRVSTNRF